MGQYPGCSGHIHQSLSDGKANLFYDGSAPRRMSALFESYLAGQVACLMEFGPLLWPTVNSYKRLVDGFWAPVKPTWGIDNRTASFPRAGRLGKATRLEAAHAELDVKFLSPCARNGLHGVEKGLKLTTPPITGTNQGGENVPRAPRTLIETTRVFRESAIARDWLGDTFVEHYAATRDWEWRQWQDAVTDWELKRYFEIVYDVTDTIAIRPLTSADASAYRALRLRGLREHPEAFTSSHEEDEHQPVQAAETRLASSRQSFWGAYRGKELCGVVGLERETRAKNRHKATVVGMYVAPEAAGHQLGARLLQALLAQARAERLEVLVLTVTKQRHGAAPVRARQHYASASSRAPSRSQGATTPRSTWCWNWPPHDARPLLLPHLDFLRAWRPQGGGGAFARARLAAPADRHRQGARPRCPCWPSSRSRLCRRDWTSRCTPAWPAIRRPAR